MRDYSGVSGGIYVAYLKLRYLLTYKAWRWWHVKHEFCRMRYNEDGEWIGRKHWAVTVCDLLEDYRTGWRSVEAILDEFHTVTGRRDRFKVWLAWCREKRWVK